jgi:hypothetical protein
MDCLEQVSVFFGPFWIGVDSAVASRTNRTPVFSVKQPGIDPATFVMDLGRHILVTDLAEQMVLDPGLAQAGVLTQLSGSGLGGAAEPGTPGKRFTALHSSRLQ